MLYHIDCPGMALRSYRVERHSKYECYFLMSVDSHDFFNFQNLNVKNGRGKVIWTDLKEWMAIATLLVLDWRLRRYKLNDIY